MACNGLKMGLFHLFRQPRWLQEVAQEGACQNGSTRSTAFKEKTFFKNDPETTRNAKKCVF